MTQPRTIEIGTFPSSRGPRHMEARIEEGFVAAEDRKAWYVTYLRDSRPVGKQERYYSEDEATASVARFASAMNEAMPKA